MTTAGANREFSPVTVRDILYVLFKYKWQFVLIFIVAIAGAVGYLLYVGQTYTAETKILVLMGNERAQALEASANKPNVVFAERNQNINDEIEILTDKNLTYAVLPKIEKWLADQPHPPLSFWKRVRNWVKDQFKNFVALLKKPLYAIGLMVELTPEQKLVLAYYASLDVQFLEQTDVIKLSFKSQSPQLAAFAANAYAEEYVERRIAIHGAENSEDFYRDQIGLFEQKLADAEKAVEDFRASKEISNLDVQKELYLREIARLDNEYRKALLTLEDLNLKLKSIKSVYKDTSEWIPTPDVGSKYSDMSSLDSHFFDTLAQRDRQLETHTSQSREVKSLEEQLARLREQKYLTLRNLLTPQIESATHRRDELSAELERKRASLATLEQSTMRLKQLERTRDIVETSYRDYKAKAEDFRINRALNARRITSVRVLGKALPPEKPSAPWTSIILGLAALMGVFLGFTYATVAEYFDHGFRRRDDVESALGIPLLATIPRLPELAGEAGGNPWSRLWRRGRRLQTGAPR